MALGDVSVSECGSMHVRGIVDTVSSFIGASQ